MEPPLIASDQLALLAALFGIAIAGTLSPQEQNVIGNFLISVGQTIVVIAAQETNSPPKNGDNHKEHEYADLRLQIQELNKQVQYLQQHLSG